MSTSIRVRPPAGARAVELRLADVIRVYDPGAPDFAIAVDLQRDRPLAAHREPVFDRLAVATLTKDDAASLIRALVREAKLGDVERVRLAYALLAGLDPEGDIATVTTVERRLLADVVERIADGQL